MAGSHVGDRRPGGDEHLDERPSVGGHPHLVPAVVNASLAQGEGQVVEQLVGQHDTLHGHVGQLGEADDDRSDPAGRGLVVLGDRAGEGLVGRLEGEVVGVTGPLGRRSLDQHVAQGRGAGRAGRQHRAGERARTGSGVDHHVGVRAAELEPPPVEGAGHDRAEQRADLRRR